jgi:hypothetical protein
MTDTSDYGEGGKQWDWMNALGGRLPRMDECPSRKWIAVDEWPGSENPVRPEGFNYYCYCSMPAGESHALPVSEALK